MTYKQHLRSFLTCTLVLLLLCGALSAWQAHAMLPMIDTESPASATPSYTVILDAGHGGEDGGASFDGILEKDLNLSMVMHLRTLLESNGIKVVLTRETDTLLYDRNVDFQGRKKALDMAERLRIAQNTENAIFISLHMNTHPITSCRGLQVWYSENNAASKLLALQIQEDVKALQAQNDRQCKAAGGNIYLLRKLSCPAVLIECGFLSNPEEAKLLADPEYQKQLSLVIFSSILHWCENDNF